MEKQDYIDLGFEELPHYTIVGALHYNLGRNRYLSVGCVGTPNEMMWICQSDFDDVKIVEDLVCIHNYDYDGYMTKPRLKLLLKSLTSNNN